MYKGQILVYRFNTFQNAVEGMDRNLFSLRDIEEKTPKEFRARIEESLDEVPPGKGYALVKWGNKMYICEKDGNNPDIDYVRHEIGWHPLMQEFK